MFGNNSLHMTTTRDLNLLVALDALLQLGSVTQAAAFIGVTAPAMSRALGRLRDAVGDPLLVRAGRSMVLTPHASPGSSSASAGGVTMGWSTSGRRIWASSARCCCSSPMRRWRNGRPPTAPWTGCSRRCGFVARPRRTLDFALRFGGISQRSPIIKTGDKTRTPTPDSSIRDEADD